MEYDVVGEGEVVLWKRAYMFVWATGLDRVDPIK